MKRKKFISEFYILISNNREGNAFFLREKRISHIPTIYQKK